MPYLPNIFSIVWQKTFIKGPQKKLVNNNIGVVCVCPSSRKSSSFTWQANDGMGGGQNSLSGLHVHASTNQFFLPGTNAKRLEYRPLPCPSILRSKVFGALPKTTFHYWASHFKPCAKHFGHVQNDFEPLEG